MPPGLQNQALTRYGLVALLALASVAAHGANDVTVRVSIQGRVTRLPLEDYVARVVAGEGQPNAAPGAQHALAITARTYALANLNRHRRAGYDLCDTTHCQVVRQATPLTRRAAEATAGRVLLHGGRPASVYYSALCGGHSELASEVWPGADDSSSHLQQDEACRNEPGWTGELEREQIQRALRAAGYRGARLRDLRILQRNDSGRVARIGLVGFTPVEVSGQDFRTAINRRVEGQPVRSTAFELRRDGDRYRFSGTGYGHGVGLCVIGAGRRAASGGSADEILKFYFPKLAIGAYQPGLSAAPAARRTAPAANAVAVRDDVVVTGARRDAERAEVVALVRKARDATAREAGVPAPGTLNVIVHRSVEAFVRATGQPWWASAATRGTEINLAPLDILRQRGQLERAIAHEVAHVFVDGPLAGKPLWVREGAASYLADPAVASTPVAPRRCPSDADLSAPASAGAHRTAMGLADACFRRAIGEGKRWQDVP